MHHTGERNVLVDGYFSKSWTTREGGGGECACRWLLLKFMDHEGEGGGGVLVCGYFSKSWTTRGERDVLVGGYFSKS